MTSTRPVARPESSVEPGGDPNAGLVLRDEVFLIPDGAGYLIYAPFEGSVLSVNVAAVDALRKMRGVVSDLDCVDARFVRRLVEAGVLGEARRPSDGSRFPPKPEHFDPQGLTLCLTTRCTMACTYCYASGGDNPKVMPWGTARAGIDWMIGHLLGVGRGELRLSFHGGGEVTTAPRMLRRAVEYARTESSRQGLKARISAALNGVLGSNLLDWVIENVDSATVSVDGLPELHDASRPLRNGRGSFRLVAATLRRMDAERFDYGLRVTVTPQALPRLVESVAFLCETFASRTIQLEPVFPVGRALNHDISAPDPHEFIGRFREAQAVAHRHGRRLRYAGANFGKITNKFCQVSDDLLVITPDGGLTACYEVGDTSDPRAGTFFFGHVDPQTGQLEVDYERLRRLRTLTVENKAHCADCFCKWHCGGGCAAKLAARGDAWDPAGDPRCVINRELTKDQLKAKLEERAHGNGSQESSGAGRWQRAPEA